MTCTCGASDCPSCSPHGPETREPCHSVAPCTALATFECIECDRPFCQAHMGPDERCENCDQNRAEAANEAMLARHHGGLDGPTLQELCYEARKFK